MEDLSKFPPYETEEPTDIGPTRPLYLVLGDDSEVTDVSFDDTGHLYQEVPEEHDLAYWREFFELSTHRVTFVEGMLVSEPRQAPESGAHGLTEEEVEQRIAEALQGQEERFLELLQGYSKKRQTKPK